MALPKHKLAVVVLANSASAGEAVTDIAREALKLALKAKTGITVSDEKVPSDRTLQPTAEDLQTLPGYYSTLLGTVRIKPAGDRFTVEADDEDLQLVLNENGYYYLQYKLLGVFPMDFGRLGKVGIAQARIADRDVLVANIDGRKTIVGERIRPAPLPPAWRDRLGSYEVVNPQDYVVLDNVELKAEDGLFQLAFTAQMPHLPDMEDSESNALVAVNDDEAVVHGLGRGKGGTVRVVRKDGEELLSYSGFLFRRIP